MAKVKERLMAEALRRKGWSIRDITAKLKISRASASIWCRDIPLTEAQQQKLTAKERDGRRRGRLLGSATNHRRKMERVELFLREGRQCIRSLSKRELLLAGIALYWGEGSKKSQLGFINSDADMVVFMYKWFQDVFGVKKEEFMPRVLINFLHKDRDAQVKRYWAKLLNLPIRQFGRTTFTKRQNTKRYTNHETYFGLLTLRIRNSTDLKYKILGLIEGLKYSRLP